MTEVTARTLGVPRLADFIRTLRRAELRISPAETLDSLAAAELVGYTDKGLLKDALAVTLAKSFAEQQTFDLVFEQFFRFDALSAGNDAAPVDAAPVKQQPVAADALSSLLLNGDQAAINQRFIDAESEVRVDQIKVFTQKSLYTMRLLQAMGVNEVQERLQSLRGQGDEQSLRMALQLGERLEALRLEARDYVERQFLLYSDSEGREIREKILSTIKLAHIEQHHIQSVRQIIHRMATKLKAASRVRTKRIKMKKLDVSGTLRYNNRFDNHIFSLKWKSKRRTRPKVFAVCDVSGSVAAYARFMLTFLYELEDVLPKVRTFAFSGRLREVTKMLKGHDHPDEAIAEVLQNCAGGSTDYGRAFDDFSELALDDLNKRSTLIILGDGRNNYGDARSDLLRRISERVGRLIWLNPEPMLNWTHGDSEMKSYRPYCHQASVCNNLQHLSRIVSDLVMATQ